MNKSRLSVHHALSVFCFLMLPLGLAGQSTWEPLTGFGLEIGGGYNQLFWEFENQFSNDEFNRTRLSFRPAAKLSYHVRINKMIGMYTFVGYNQIGGKSDAENIIPAWENSTYEDEYRIETIELGLMPSFSIDRIKVSVGGKYNHHLSFTHIYNHQNRPDGFNGEDRDSDVDFIFADQSVDLGLRFEYSIYKGLMVASEAWFGITELSDPDLSNNSLFAPFDGSLDLRQNHFRIYLGYRF